MLNSRYNNLGPIELSFIMTRVKIQSKLVNDAPKPESMLSLKILQFILSLFQSH